MASTLKTRTAIGMSLVELLIVITIISILAAIGYPNYISFKLDTRRNEAKSTIIDMHSNIQRFLTASNTSALNATDLTTLYTLPLTSKNGYYSVDITNLPNYIITATATGIQLDDANCTLFSMDNNGVKTSQNSSNQLSTGCW